MRVFIHNFTYIEKGIKCRGKKFTHPKGLKLRFPNLDSSRTISAFTDTLANVRYQLTRSSREFDD